MWFMLVYGFAYTFNVVCVQLYVDLTFNEVMLRYGLAFTFNVVYGKLCVSLYF